MTENNDPESTLSHLKGCSVSLHTEFSTIDLKPATTSICLLRQASTHRMYIKVSGYQKSGKQSFISKQLPLINPKLHGSAMDKGMASITLSESSHVSIFLNNCPVKQLKTFMRLLTAKYTSSLTKLQETPKGIRRNNLHLSDVSPLCQTDLNAVAEKLNRNIQPTTPKSNARSLQRIPSRPFSDTASTVSSINRFLNETPLDKDQQMILNACVKEKTSIFFTGAAGTGKSHLLKIIINSLPPFPETAVTGSTGVSASQLINGMTLHAWLGLGVISEKADGNLLAEKLKKSKPQVYKRIKSCKALIIDEISMVPGTYFEQLDVVTKAVRQISDPFGGIQIICTGDFLQLPPVNSEKMAFETECWAHLKIMKLNKVYRQGGDAKFARMLELMRVGKANETLVKILQKQRISNDAKVKYCPTTLVTHVKDVQRINRIKFSDLEENSSDVREFKSIDMINGKSIIASQSSKLGFKEKFSMVEESIKLCVGCQVMLTKNISVSQGLVNGARGVVIGFGQKYPKIKWYHAKNVSNAVVSPLKFTCRDGDGTLYQRLQLPLTLAWAISVHKSQGMSLHYAVLNLSKVFETGQAYVALSRLTSLGEC